ncbi:MAG: IS4 family transposase [Candidatus Rhabdochlamydia sp.]
MKHICELKNILAEHFDWNKSRLTVLANVLIGLFVVRTVKLSDLSTVLYSEAKTLSNYKRLQRFFTWLVSVNNYNYLTMKFVIFVLGLKNKKSDLVLDRTDWKFGKKHINILTLGVNVKGVAIPLVWISLGRAGNSKTADRIELLKKVINEIEIKSLTADREFIGEEWFKFLLQANIPIYIRIKKDTQVVRRNNDYTISLKDLFAKLKQGKKKVLKGQYTILGLEVNLAASRNNKGELLIVLTNRCPYKALKIYKKRWSIETLFGYFKTKGFNFEDTHMTDVNKIASWMLLLTIVVTWTMKTSLVLKEKIPLATHGRLRKSIFRVVFERLKRCLSQPSDRLKELLEYLKLLRRKKHVVGVF